LLPLVIRMGFVREEAGAMEVEIGVEVQSADVLDQQCPTLTDIAVAEVFFDNGSILAFRQSVVTAVRGACLRELD